MIVPYSLLVTVTARAYMSLVWACGIWVSQNRTGASEYCVNPAPSRHKTWHMSAALVCFATTALCVVQLESIVYACQRHERMLPDNQRAGFFIGDGAGVGKGRTIAGARPHHTAHPKLYAVSKAADM